jgi:hypothetical protein
MHLRFAFLLFSQPCFFSLAVQRNPLLLHLFHPIQYVRISLPNVMHVYPHLQSTSTHAGNLFVIVLGPQTSKHVRCACVPSLGMIESVFGVMEV